MKKAFRSMIVVAALAVSAAVVQAEPFQCGQCDGPPPAGRHFRKITKELGLTADQKTQVQDIFRKRHEEARPIHEKLAVERKAEQALIQADTLDEAAIRAQAAKVAALHADMAVHRAQVSQDLRKVLTPEQFTKFKARQEQRGKGMDRRRAKGPGNGPCRE